MFGVCFLQPLWVGPGSAMPHRALTKEEMQQRERRRGVRDQVKEMIKQSVAFDARQENSSREIEANKEEKEARSNLRSRLKLGRPSLKRVFGEPTSNVDNEAVDREKADNAHSKKSKRARAKRIIRSATNHFGVSKHKKEKKKDVDHEVDRQPDICNLKGDHTTANVSRTHSHTNTEPSVSLPPSRDPSLPYDNLRKPQDGIPTPAVRLTTPSGSTVDLVVLVEVPHSNSCAADSCTDTDSHLPVNVDQSFNLVHQSATTATLPSERKTAEGGGLDVQENLMPFQDVEDIELAILLGTDKATQETKQQQSVDVSHGLDVASNLPSDSSSDSSGNSSSTTDSEAGEDTNNSSVDDSDHDPNDEDDDDDYEEQQRKLWGRTRDIHADAVKQLVSDITAKSLSEITKVTLRTGKNNRVFIAHYDDKPQLCIRVPACGWTPAWTDGDRDMLRHTVQTMAFLSHNTSMPIPRVVRYDTELDNAIGAPYIAMEFVAGVCPTAVWYGDNTANGGVYWVDRKTHKDINEPSEYQIQWDDKFQNFATEWAPISKGLEEKRQTMLKSLASYLAELQKFSFNAKGAPIFSSDSTAVTGIGPAFADSFGMTARSCSSSHDYVSPDGVGPHRNMTAYLLSTLAQSRDAIISYLEEELKDEDDSGRSPYRQICEAKGRYEFMLLVIRCLPQARTDLEDFKGATDANDIDSIYPAISTLFQTDHAASDTTDETTDGTTVNVPEHLPFVLAPPDFGAQNLLCDPVTGAITAILDWDRTETAPRYLGWALPPCWLESDHWGEEVYSYPFRGKTMHADDYERYRKDYARYLRNACVSGVDDWKYTEREPIFEEIVDAIVLEDPMRLKRTAEFIASKVFPHVNTERLFERTLAFPLLPGMKTMTEARVKKYLGLISDQHFNAIVYGAT